MRITRGMKDYPATLLLATLCLLMVLLVGCGSKSSTTTGGTGGTKSVPTPATSSTPTEVKGYGTANGCPSDAVVSTTLPKANVLVQQNNTNDTITAHKGDVVEIRLPFGNRWSGPTTSQGALELQQPYGYALKTDNVCIWRFTAKDTGNAQLEYFGRALCKPGEMCPLYVKDVTFNIEVK